MWFKLDGRLFDSPSSSSVSSSSPSRALTDDSSVAIESSSPLLPSSDKSSKASSASHNPSPAAHGIFGKSIQADRKALPEESKAEMCYSTHYTFSECKHVSPINPYRPPALQLGQELQNKMETSNGHALNNGPPLPPPPSGMPDPRPFQYIADKDSTEYPAINSLPFFMADPPTPPMKDDDYFDSRNDDGFSPSISRLKPRSTFQNLRSLAQSSANSSCERKIPRDTIGAPIQRCWWKPVKPERHCKVECTSIRLPGKCRRCVVRDQSLATLLGTTDPDEDNKRSKAMSPGQQRQQRHLAATQAMVKSQGKPDLYGGGGWI